jgi:hypothetical protein
VFAALAVVLCATGCAGRSTTASTATATLSPSPLPSRAGTPAPAAARVTAPSAARATPVPRRFTGPRSMDVPARASARAQAVPPPEILGASVSPSVVRSGTVVRATVRTTAGVVSVVAHAGGVAIAVPRVGPGLFAGSTTIPPLPPFVHGSYPVTFVARDARGASTQSAVGVSVR